MTRDDWAYDLAGKLIRQALEDYRCGYTHVGIPDAKAFLIACGLLSEDGTLDARIQMKPKKGQTKG